MKGTIFEHLCFIGFLAMMLYFLGSHFVRAVNGETDAWFFVAVLLAGDACSAGLVWRAW